MGNEQVGNTTKKTKKQNQCSAGGMQKKIESRCSQLRRSRRRTCNKGTGGLMGGHASRLENATTSTTTANGGNTAGAATPLTAYMAAHALGRDGNDRNNVSRISNALRQINNDEETDSDMPSLASDGASPSGSRSNTAGSNTGAATTSSIIGA